MFPTIWGNPMAYLPFSFVTFFLLLLGSLGTYIWNVFLGSVWWEVFIWVFGNEYTDLGFFEIVSKILGGWLRGWFLQWAVTSGLAQAFNSHATAAILFSSTFIYTSILYLIDPELYTSVDLTKYEDAESVSITIATITHYLKYSEETSYLTLIA